MLQVIFGRDTEDCSKLILWALAFLLNNNADVFCSFLIVKEHPSVSSEAIAGGKLVFMCLRGGRGNNAILPVKQNLNKALPTWKIMEICPDQR